MEINVTDLVLGDISWKLVTSFIFTKKPWMKISIPFISSNNHFLSFSYISSFRKGVDWVKNLFFLLNFWCDSHYSNQRLWTCQMDTKNAAKISQLISMQLQACCIYFCGHKKSIKKIKTVQEPWTLFNQS